MIGTRTTAGKMLLIGRSLPPLRGPNWNRAVVLCGRRLPPTRSVGSARPPPCVPVRKRGSGEEQRALGYHRSMSVNPAAMTIPAQLRWIAGSEEGRLWLEALPNLLDTCAERWSLRIDSPYEGSHLSFATRATRADDSEVVLKIQFPHRECEHEAAALTYWNGNGAVRLLAHDAGRHALLVERCRPGTHLSERGVDEALSALTGLLPRLWKPVGAPFVTLGDEAARWAENVPRSWEAAGRPFERSLIDEAVRTLRELSESQGEQVLLHQDLHAGNVLRAEREPWLAIDPKPLAGEREFGVAPFVRDSELGHSRELVQRRLDRLTSDLGLDRERARGWAFAQALAWAFQGTKVIAGHIETAQWLRATTSHV